ncbi:MAG: ATP-binding protein [Armatimonadetes bacterium]|nr:ATP-binding protein [Armatimonadota bacterium]
MDSSELSDIFNQPADALWVVAFCGMPGTGKTCQAMALERRSGAIRLSRDDLRVCLFAKPDYSDGEKRLCFEIMLTLARHHLSLARSVILEGMPFSRRCERDAVRSLAREHRVPFHLVECVSTAETAISRIAAQQGSHVADDRVPDLYRRVAERFEVITPDENAVILRTG